MNNFDELRPLALRPRKAARALSMSEKALWNLTQPRGPIPAAKVGRLVLYDVRDLLGFLDAMKAAATDQWGKSTEGLTHIAKVI